MERIICIRIFVIGFLIGQIIGQAIARSLGGVLVLSILLAGYSIWVYHTRERMLPTKHNGTGKTP